MPLELIATWGYRCRRCKHGWVPRGLEEPEGEEWTKKAGIEIPPRPPDPENDPTICPKCKSPYWSRERRSG